MDELSKKLTRRSRGVGETVSAVAFAPHPTSREARTPCRDLLECAGEEEGGRDGARDAGLPDLELRAQGEAAAHRECQVCHGGRPLIVEVWGLSVELEGAWRWTPPRYRGTTRNTMTSVQP